MNPSPSPSPSASSTAAPSVLDYAAHVSANSDVAIAVLLALAVLAALSLGVLLVRAI